jgi:hypothetical protein
MIQQGVLRTFQYVEEYWQAPLTRELARRIATMPANQLHHFANSYPVPSMGELRLDPLEPGKLRPSFSSGDPELHIAAAGRLLLYVPSVILDSSLLFPFPFVWGDGQEIHDGHRETALDLFSWYANVLPLIRDGSILFTPHSRGYHPSRSFGVSHALREAPASTWTETGFAGLTGDELMEELSVLTRTIAGPMIQATEHTGNALALSRAERAGYALVLGGRPVDATRVSRLSTLSALTLPNFTGDAAALVNLRNSDLFEGWRTDLLNALSLLAEIPESDSAANEASAVIADLLVSSQDKVLRESRQSGALGALSAGFKGLILTGLGAAGSAAALQDPTGALIGGAVSTGGEIAMEYIQAARTRSVNSAIWDVLLAFHDQSGT